MWEDDKVQTQSQCSAIPGRDLEAQGITDFVELAEEDQRLYHKYQHAIEQAIRQTARAEFPEDFQFVPTSIARQKEARNNCYIRFDLPHCSMTIKILPKRYESDLSQHLTVHRDSFAPEQPASTEDRF